MNPSPVQILKQFQALHHKPFRKQLGQNFLLDPNVLAKIAQAADLTEQDTVIEIGSGLGFLTTHLVRRAQKVIALETDRDFFLFSQSLFSSATHLQLLHADFMTIDYPTALFSEQDIPPFVVIGNLPYALASRMLRRIFEKRPHPKQLILMFQKEVAERLTAKPGERAYGFLSIWAQYFSKVERLFQVRRTCFYPVPKVDSEVVRFMPHGQFPCSVGDETAFFQFISKLFGQRRKMLLTVLPRPRERWHGIFRELGFDLKVRAETLPLSALTCLFRKISAKID